MIRVSVEVPVEAPAALVWSVLANWEHHSRWVPATRVWVTHQTDGVGTTFVGRTGIGPLAFDDPMEVTLFAPPKGPVKGICEIRKTGRVVRGTAGFTVEPLTGSTCRVTWREDIWVAPYWLTRTFTPVLAWFARQAFRGVLTRMASDIQRGLY